MALAGKRSILIAEDNPADVFLIRQALKHHDVDCDIRVIADGQEVINFITSLEADGAAGWPDAVVLDMHLPKRTGDEVLNRLRASSWGRQTPAVMLSGSDSPRDREGAEVFHVHFFQKSSSLSEFFELGAVLKRLIEPDDRPEDTSLLHNSAQGA